MSLSSRRESDRAQIAAKPRKRKPTKADLERRLAQVAFAEPGAYTSTVPTRITVVIYSGR